MSLGHLLIRPQQTPLRFFAISKVTKAQHCRADVYLICYGCVAVDPADVRKGVLEEPPGNLPLDNEIVVKARAGRFGSWKVNRMAYNFAHDIALSGPSGAPVGFLMYPQAETADSRLGRLLDRITSLSES